MSDEERKEPNGDETPRLDPREEESLRASNGDYLGANPPADEGPGALPPPPQPPPPGCVTDRLPPLAGEHGRIPEKPGLVLALNILALCGGITSVLMGLVVGGVSCCIWIPWLYALIVGIFGIVHGAKLLGNDHEPPKKGLYIMYIFTILNGDIITLTIGIICISFCNSPVVKSHYAARGLYY